ncbi:copper amine oxidase N-terminal domain-containing protein [Paenibacillus sp. 32352]|uniref:copper amine oxidase N-terminal domain-containing protein n=1 Tax=Paenibacillus sp. 32352 TaxID=1969111 RepID=UPI0009AF00E4|nr:copper amine oxidase N-terminal domain-containing protein [Paenibacillus sp. 32352]
MKKKTYAFKLTIALTIAAVGLSATPDMTKASADNRAEMGALPAISSEAITVQVDGSPLVLEQPPIIRNGSTLVPLRSIFERLGAEVEWDGNTSTVTARKGQNVIRLTVGSGTAALNEKEIFLEAPPVIVNGNTMVPVRFIAESLGAKVDWESDTRTVRITQTEGGAAKPPVSPQVSVDKIVTGTFTYPWYNPLNNGTAEVTKLDDGRYHLHVSVVHGFSHNLGELDSDFTYDGENFVFSDPEYSKVTMTFTENSITIDYPGYGFGGFNAEPKGTFYLHNSGIHDAPFLTKLYTRLQLPDVYRNGFSDVFTYYIDSTKVALLVRSYSTMDRNKVISENLAIYDTNTQTIEPLGEIQSYNKQELGKKLAALSLSEEFIYEVLNKEYADRFIELQMERFDNGDLTLGDLDQFRLTEEEAFYIVTGEKKTTAASHNVRDQDNNGSIYRSEVDHSDADSVTIHIYELVRHNPNDEHTATIDWLEVNRSNGRVKSILFE